MKRFRDQIPEAKLIVATIIAALAAGIVQAVEEGGGGVDLETVISGAVAGAAVLIVGWFTPNVNPGPSSTKAVLKARARAAAITVAESGGPRS